MKGRRDDPRPLITAGTVLGMGLGGFLDGIVFHQILQLHGMLSAIYPPTTVVHIELNMLWDGLFHALTWCLTVAGIVLLWRAARWAQEPWAARAVAGAALMGWGLFNVVEGTLNHFALQVHHVVEQRGLSIWDGAFLGFGVALVVIGALLVRSSPALVPPRKVYDPYA
jgi:uncharacterized membrane protein